MELVVSILLAAPNTERFEPTYRWQAVEADKDDNKFVDYAAASSADYLVTNDRHIHNLLREYNFHPPLPIIGFKAFQAILNG